MESSNSDRLKRVFMWNRVKKLSVINTKMSSTQPDEIAIEAINAPISSETTITDPILQEKMDQIVPHEDDDDDSSIEALAWTDFTDDELETAKELAAKEFPSNAQQQQQQEDHEQDEKKEEVEKENLDPNLVSESQISEESCSSSNSKESEEDSPCSVMSISTSQTLVLTGNDDDGDIAIVNYNDSAKQDKSSNMEMDETMSNLIPPGSLFEDKASNAPVLDDGPIWGTGTKLYKFHENRERNQKLTFWVLMSVVLAIGIGVGNLVAYNEYENEQRVDGPSRPIYEHKPIDQQHCPAPYIPTVAPYINNPSVAESSINVKVLDKNFEQDIGKDNHFNTILKSPGIGSESSSSPYVSSLHTETLAHVVKSIDELSKKIDIFNNTTKQLSGIIVMKEDVKSKVRSSTDEFSQFLPTFNDDISKQHQWENKMDEPVCSKSQKKVNVDKKLKPNHDIPEKQDKHTINNNNNDNSKLKSKEPKQNNKSKNREVREEEELNNEVSGKKKQKKEKNPKINADDKYQTDKTKEEKSKRKQEKYDKKKQQKQQQQSTDKTIKEEKKEKKHFQKEQSIVSEETGKQFQYQQEKQKKFKRQTAVDRESENDKYNKKNKKPKTRKAEYDTKNYNNNRNDKSFENDIQQPHNHQQKQKNVYNKPEKDYYEKEYKSDKKTKKPKKNNDDTKFVINENQGNSFFVASETIPEKRKRKNSEKEIEKNKNNEKPQHVNDKNGKKYKKDKPADSSSSDDEENHNQKSNMYKQVKVSTDYKMNKDQDWNSERAKARESIRVYQNWNSDFNSDNNDYKVKRKRSSSWQIERDRLREKIRKNEDD